MKIVIADTGALISLGIIGHIDLIEKVFGSFYIAKAVWEELLKYEDLFTDNDLTTRFEKQVKEIHSENYLSLLMDYGESESVILYKELGADYLLIDDNKARLIAESLDVNCVGSIGVLVKAKQKGYIKALKPSFKIWLSKNRLFSVKLLNQILVDFGEEPI